MSFLRSYNSFNIQLYIYVHVYVNYVHLHTYVYMIKLTIFYSVYIHVTTHASSYVCPAGIDKTFLCPFLMNGHKKRKQL